MSAVPAGPAPAGQGTVLIVDDDEDVRFVVASILEEAGFGVEQAANGRRGLELASERAYDAVVSDIRMPDMDGLQLLEQLRQRDLDLPVVLLTGGPAVESAMRAVELGAFRYLLKPVSAGDLGETLERAVRAGRVARWERAALQGERSAPSQRAELEACFERALDTLWLAVQPIVRAGDGSLFALEALVRSGEPLLAAPAALLAAAERLGRLEQLGCAIRARAATIPLPDGALLFVNVHPSDLASDDLLSATAPLAARAGSVVLEVTEGASPAQVPELRARLARLRALGYRIALDDLGAGYAGLGSFAILEPHVAKLDMSIVRGVDREAPRRRLVTSLIDLCRGLGTLLVAEGVETEGERACLRELGCDLLQGFLVGRPAPAGAACGPAGVVARVSCGSPGPS